MHPTVSIALLGAAALGGAVLAVLRFGGRAVPLPASLLHGALAAGGLLTLALLAFGGDGAAGALRLSFGLFAVTALGGFALFALRRGPRPMSRGLVAGHALLAVGGFVALVGALW